MDAAVSIRANRVRRQAVPAVLATIVALLIALLFQTDRDHELYRSLSNRYRFHAIPVALSEMHHGAPHDYTGYKYIAWPFQDSTRDADELIAEAIAKPPVANPEPYLWLADDRGLSDYVITSFTLFGPRMESLSKFYFVILTASVGLYFLGFWRNTASLMAPILVLFGMLALAHVLKLRTEIPSSGLIWQEEIALYESRIFDLLALISCFHLALATAPGATRSTLLTAAFQSAILAFLFHARSSLGWQYLALFAVLAARFGFWGLSRWRRMPTGSVTSFLIVGAMLAASLVGLAQYKRATYNPIYFAEGGPRTFWHNAIMGFSYHPQLRQSLRVTAASDHEAVDLVLRRMREKNDTRIDESWNTKTIMDSLGGHARFDWNAYEEAAKEAYLDVWREHPREAVECYAWYKPKDVAKHVGTVLRLLGREARQTRGRNLLIGTGLLAVAMVLVVRVSRRDPILRINLGRTGMVVAGLIPFSLIPGIAFYTALTTVSCFDVCAVALLAFGVLSVATRRTACPDSP